MKEAVRVTPISFEQSMAQYFSYLHKECFGHGPRNVAVTFLDGYIVIVADGVLNRYEKSLAALPDGPKNVIFARELLFNKIAARWKREFADNLHLLIDEIRHKLDVDTDKSVCIMVTNDQQKSVLKPPAGATLDLQYGS